MDTPHLHLTLPSQHLAMANMKRELRPAIVFFYSEFGMCSPARCELKVVGHTRATASTWAERAREWGNSSECGAQCGGDVPR